MQMNQFIRTVVGADLSRPSTVTLSEAKGLSPWASRCFAELTLSGANVLSMTEFPCHPERSEGSVAPQHDWR